MIYKLSNKIAHILGYHIIKEHPRPSVRKAKSVYGNNKIIAVEIGAYKAENSKNILKNLNIETLYLIDPYESYQGYKNSSLSGHIEKVEKVAKKRLNNSKEKVKWIKKFSEKAISDIPDSVDFIYIDGNHNYEYVKKDIEMYFKKLKKGGVLSGHDVNLQGVTRAFSEFVTKNKIKEFGTEDLDWWLIKQ